MRILQLSDTHLPEASGPDEDGLDARRILSGLLHDCRHLGDLDLIAVTGDVSEDGSVPGYRDALEVIGAFARERSAAVVFCPGNHDDRRAFAQVLGRGHVDAGGELCGSPLSSGAAGVDHLAAVSDLAGLRVITLDSLVPDRTSGEIDEDQLTALGAELTRPAPRGSLLLLHHPPVAIDGDFWRSVNLQQPDLLVDALRGSDVRAVLCGHNHLQLAARLGDIPMWIGPGVISRIDLTVAPGLERAVRGAQATLIDLDAPGGPIFAVLQARDDHAGGQVYLVDQVTGEPAAEPAEEEPSGLTTGPPPLGLSAAPYADTDLAELVVLQRCCWVQEAIANTMLDIPALHETSEQVAAWAQEWTTICVRQGRRLVGAVRGRQVGRSWEVGRLMVAPDLAGQGLGRWLLNRIEAMAPADVEQFVLFTGARSTRNIRLYERAGYRLSAPPADAPGHIPGAVYLIKSADEGR